jgi:hypothetical protein
MKKKLLIHLLLVPIVGGWFWWSATRAPKIDPANEPKWRPSIAGR